MCVCVCVCIMNAHAHTHTHTRTRTHTHTHTQASRAPGGKVSKVARGVSSRGGRWQVSVTREEEKKEEHPNSGPDVPGVSSRGIRGGRLHGSTMGARGGRRRKTFAESRDEGRVFAGSGDGFVEDDVTFGEDDVGVEEMVEAHTQGHI